ncbi:DotA/TraY family protein [Oleiagrimonas citrea]|uniref:DotA/TraY family protein n=1 Tax=Oleiagrimonas citrea TaxID=1665687 RepID=A0A846ZLC7_9GAMM|nr:DotA/TraY family protein [Oleiagrimonas citrea]NKZ38358.1 DotA/TraY family protein [Oleiagrimonas citrea]
MKRIAKILSLTALLSLIPSAVWAATPDLFTVPDGDISKKLFIDYLFGPLVGASAGSNPFGSVLGVFSAAVLMIGGVMVSYNLLAGTLNSAHEGHMLGKRWSTMWVPLRITLASSVLLPVPGLGGFCVIQAIVIWLAMQGIGLADKVWTNYTSADNSIAATGVFHVDLTSELYKVANSMAQSNLCAQGVMKYYDNANKTSSGGPSYASNILQPLSAPTYAFEVSGDKNAITYGPNKNWTNCGSVALDAPLPTAKDISDGFIDPTLSPITKLFQATSHMGSDVNAAMRRDMNGMNLAIANATQQVVDAYGDNSPAAQQNLQAAESHLYSVIAQQVQGFNQDINTVAAGSFSMAFTAYDPMGDLAKGGWAVAGGYYMYIVHAISAISKAAHNLPQATAPRQPSAFDSSAGSYAQAQGIAPKNYQTDPFNYAQQIMKSSLVSLAAQGAQLGNSDMSALGYKDGSSGDGEGATNSVAKKILSIMKMAGLNDGLGNASKKSGSANPILLIQNLGEGMIYSAWTALGAGVTAGIFSDVLGNLLLGLFALLIVPGATFAFYIPMLPYILWIGAFIGWLTLLLEAMIGAPMWALSHLSPDGDGVVGRAGQGYMLVLSLMLKPALMVLGLIFSIVLMDPLGRLVNASFLNAFSIATTDSSGQAFSGIMGLTATLAGLFIYATVMVSITRRVFDLIHIVPDAVLRWIGGPGGRELGEGAQHAGQSERGVLTAMGGMKLMGDAANSAARGRNQERRERLKRSAQDSQAKADTQDKELPRPREDED